LARRDRPQAARRFHIAGFREQDAGPGSLIAVTVISTGVGFIKPSPQKIIAKGTNWRSLNELKRELKARG
jgi:hypothetical protein